MLVRVTFEAIVFEFASIFLEAPAIIEKTTYGLLYDELPAPVLLFLPYICLRAADKKIPAKFAFKLRKRKSCPHHSASIVN